MNARNKAILDALQKDDWKGTLIYDEGSKSMASAVFAAAISAVVLGVAMEGLQNG